MTKRLCTVPCVVDPNDQVRVSLDEHTGRVFIDAIQIRPGDIRIVSEVGIEDLNTLSEFAGAILEAIEFLEKRNES